MGRQLFFNKFAQAGEYRSHYCLLQMKDWISRRISSIINTFAYIEVMAWDGGSYMKDTVHIPVEEESLATKLKRYRLQVGYTQKNVAEILNISRSTYTYYELGKTSPDPATLNRIAKLFEVSVEEFFSDEPASRANMLFDSGAKRVSKKVKADPEKIGDLTTSEKSIVAFLRDKGIPAGDALEVLKDRFDSDPKSVY